MKYIIGVDIGTSGTKAIAFNIDGAVLIQRICILSSISPHAGENEIDPDILLDATSKQSSASLRTLNQKRIFSGLHSVVQCIACLQ